jgi:hypothetical protein
LPFTKTQAVLKRILPERWFTILYRIATQVYNVWTKISDRVFYISSYIFYTLKGDSRNAKRMMRIHSVLPYTLVGRSGLLATYDLASKIENNKIDGCFVECGVAMGGCSALMAMVANDNNGDRKVWLFDSFEGLPNPTIEDAADVVEHPGKDKHSNALHKGYCLGTYDEVERLLFSRLQLSKNNIFMIEGWFQDTLPEYKDKIGDISFLRIDGDWYESTKCCLENLYDNVISGGYIFIDDYYSVAGCKKAVDEFLQKKGVDVRFAFDNRGGAYFVKPYLK